jgi:uncharacterized protein YabN with tetrapyrrole methylase and pyrophosphatase domain
VVDLGRLYEDGKPRLATYEAVAHAVLTAAKASPPVALVTYGHPLVGCTPSQILLERAPRLGLVAKALPGVSSLDCLLVDLGLDPFEDGLQAYEATDVLLRRRSLQPDVPCFIFQPGTVESSLHCTAPNRPGRFHRLTRYLLRFYSPNHEVIVAGSAMESHRPSTLTRVLLRELEQAHGSLRGAVTIFLPPVESRPVKDRAVEALLNDPVHARSITAVDGPSGAMNRGPRRRRSRGSRGARGHAAPRR